MCLAVPGAVLSIDEAEAVTRRGRVDFGGVVREVALALVPEVRVGDYVLVHAGVAIAVVDEGQAGDILDAIEGMRASGEAAP